MTQTGTLRMFGERYFATRERLSGVIRRIASLAGETGTAIEEALPLDQLEESLHGPFLFVVSGEVNAGKSTLLNALFGADLCKVSNLPETQRVIHYRHAFRDRDREISPLHEERYRTDAFLRDFHVVDTPGTNSLLKGHLDLTARYFPTAELILFIFPVTNPWGAATWDFITKLPSDCSRRIAIIIQQADQKEDADLEVILGHMRDLSMKRLGYIPPIFAVSGKIALEAKRAHPPAPERFRESGFPVFEQFISDRICESPARRADLATWRGKSLAALRLVEDRIEDQTRSLKLQDRFLDQIEGEIDAMREMFINRLSQHLSGVAEVFQTEGVGISKTLYHRLGALRSILRLFLGDKTGQRMETLFIERMQAAIESVAELDGSEVVGFCRQHWAELGPRVLENIGVDLGGAEAVEQTLADARHRFVERLGRIARQGIAQLKVRNQLDKELRKRNIALKSFTFMTLAFITAGATCGAFAVPLAPMILCGVAGLFLAGGLFAAWRTRTRIVADFRGRLIDTCGAFATTLQSDYEEALRVFFQDYGASLRAVRTHLVGEKLALEPRLKQWQELFLTLKAIEQEH